MTTTTTTSSSMDLAPSGGTPVSQWFRCCMPRPQKKKQRSITFAAKPEEIEISRDLPVEEKTADTWEESDDDMPEIPDMDNDPPKTSRNPSASQEDDWVAQFWKMIVSMLFFQWMQQAKERQKLKNEPETAK